MERDGQIIRNRGGAFGLVDRMDLITGRVIGHRDGYGFVRPDDGSVDLFFSPRQMRSLMHGDRVVARVAKIDRNGRREGTLVEVIERGRRSSGGAPVARKWRDLRATPQFADPSRPSRSSGCERRGA